MNKIYKYLPYRNNMFDDFSLRATQKGGLNDPFELNPAEETINSIIKQNSGDNIFDDITSFRDQIYLTDTGIISFTENYNNLLMWSHYANEHRGLVIEFDHIKLLNYFINKLGKELPIERVQYNRERFSPLRTGSNNSEMYLTKSDDWIYEKEHRILPKLCLADSIKLDKKTYTQLIEFYECKELFEVVLETEKFVTIKIDREEAKYIDNLQVDGSSIEDEGELSMTPSEALLEDIYNSLSTIQTSIFLFDIPLFCISSIYLGCRMDKDDRMNIQNKLSDMEITIYQASLSKKLFSLDFKEHEYPL